MLTPSKLRDAVTQAGQAADMMITSSVCRILKSPKISIFLENDRANTAEMSFCKVFTIFLKKEIPLKVLYLHANGGNSSYKLSTFVVIVHQLYSCSYRILFKLNVSLSHKCNICLIIEKLHNAMIKKKCRCTHLPCVNSCFISIQSFPSTHSYYYFRGEKTFPAQSQLVNI